jgi:tRNA1(Val) A37 N6-methylase TrmN6
MKIFEAHITNNIIDFFVKRKTQTFSEINSEINAISGIINFFDNEIELLDLKQKFLEQQNIVEEPDRAEYGDFQTNLSLANKVCNLLKNKEISPEIVIEPTCGKGNFILSVIQNFENIRQIFGIEIYKPYIWQTKFNIFDYFLINTEKNKPKIEIINANIFDFNFGKQLNIKSDNILILGNPPWVTNSMLSTLNSGNLPQKSNFKKHNGLDAITGKGNFDIAEYITYSLLDNFSNQNGHIAFLVKNTVIKNLINDQNKSKRPIGKIEKHVINAKEEFDVSVDASLLYCKLNTIPETICNEFDFYTQNKKQQFGWVGQKFVSNLETYRKTSYIDGKSPYVWRQGIKHDASKVMEFERRNGHFLNNNNVEFDLEEDLVYGLLKSSDLKTPIINKTRKYTIITQRKVGQETKYIGYNFPKTYLYLTNNIAFFKSRKSSIYTGKPQFSIFGIGDYSFKPYKVAISGMYKTTTFSLVVPQNEKTIMLDDTCYFIGFDNKEFALITQFLLNKHETQDFIQSISFEDSKRKITKDLLMRIDLFKIAENTDCEQITNIDNAISKDVWENYLQKIKHKDEPLNLFGFTKNNNQYL